MIRLTVHFAGHVQGVGFRYTTREVAGRHRVAGYVQNLPDGRVRLVAEGRAAEVEAFVADVASVMKRHITRTTRDESPATGEFGSPEAGALIIRH